MLGKKHSSDGIFKPPVSYNHNETLSTDLKSTWSDKTWWLLASSRQGLSLLGDIHPKLKLGVTTTDALDSVCLLGVDINSDLSLDQHISKVAAHCFYRLNQLRRIPWVKITGREGKGARPPQKLGWGCKYNCPRKLCQNYFII